MGMKKPIITALCASSFLTACTTTEIGSALEAGKQNVKQRAADAAAETLRQAVIEQGTKRGLAPSSLVLIKEVAGTLPSLAISYVDVDANDAADTGSITVTAFGMSSCLTLPTTSSDGSVASGACR